MRLSEELACGAALVGLDFPPLPGLKEHRIPCLYGQGRVTAGLDGKCGEVVDEAWQALTP